MSALPARHAAEDAPMAKAAVIGLVVLFILVMLVLPLAAVFAQALAKRIGASVQALRDRDALSAVRMTAAAFAVPINTAFGLCASWAIARHDVPFKSLLVSLIDPPFSVAPVVAGLAYVLVFGLQGWFGGWLGQSAERDAARHQGAARKGRHGRSPMD